MKSEMSARSKSASSRVKVSTRLIGVGLILAVLPLIFSASAQVIVKTLGGGPVEVGGPAYGFVNGPTLQESQFDNPFGCALDSAGNLFIADRDNGQIRKLAIAADKASTYLSGLNLPVAVAIDAADNLYVASQGEGTIRKFDSFGNPMSIISGLSAPTAIALDGTTNIYVTELGGAVKRISPTGTVTRLANGFNQPRGVALMDSGAIAVSENHAIRLIDPITLNITYLAGSASPGFTNGPAQLAKFNQPQQLAKAPNGSLVVADRMNHRVRVVTTNGITTTLYGIEPDAWASDYPGWEDGSVDFAEAREPVGVTIAKDGTVYSTEVFYHLIRKITGADLSATVPGGPGGGGTNGTNVVNIVVPSPSINPSAGYFPMGQVITVTSTVADVFYTLDGGEPTTNSLRLALTNNIGMLQLHETLRDLTSLRLKAFDQTNASVTVSGTPSSISEIGVTRNLVAGIGSTVIIPLVVNLRTNDALRSIQFRVEITPNAGTTSIISDQFRSLSISTNDFVRVVTSSSDSLDPATFGSIPYLLGDTRGLTISFIGTNANFSIKNFAVVAMLAVPIPVTANPGDSYRISVLEPSGTSDGQQEPVELLPMSNRSIMVTNVAYTAGDSALSGWYNAGDFGNGDLKNNDVNNAFLASLGGRVPYDFSDLFNAMDVFPEDVPGTVGGDGQIRYLDWQVILARSLRLDPTNWKRSWAPGGTRVSTTTTLGGSPNLPAQTQTYSPGDVWSRQALLGAMSLEKVSPSSTVDVPIYLTVSHGSAVSGLQFRATVTPDRRAAPLYLPVSFVPAKGVPFPRSVDGLPMNQVACAWNLGAFEPSLQGSNVLGYLRISLPINAVVGSCYSITFANADGSPDLITQYDFETLPGCVWIQTTDPRPFDIISVEWKTNFFGGLESLLADPMADPDGDGIPNWAEYVAGTNPMNAKSRLVLLGPASGSNQLSEGFKLRWLSAPGKLYVLECTSDLLSSHWNTIATNVTGTGEILEYIDTNRTRPAQFYRVRISP